MRGPEDNMEGVDPRSTADSSMEYPDIRCSQEKISFDKDAQGAYEDRFTIHQDGKNLSVDYYSYEPYEQKTSEGTYKSEILCWNEEYVKLLHERGHFQYFNRKKKDFASNDDDFYTHFTYPDFKMGDPEGLALLLDMMKMSLEKVLDRSFEFSLAYPENANLNEKHLRFYSDEIDGIKLRCMLNSIRRIELRTVDHIHPFELEVGINPDYSGKKINQGYVKGTCLHAKEAHTVPPLRALFESDPRLNPI